MILELRGPSQILFGFLPEQTVDLRNKTWKVKRWNNPYFFTIDQDVVRHELLSSILPWSNEGIDNDLRARLLGGADIQIISPSQSGVDVEPFPRLYRCRACFRLEKREDRNCKCGARAWGAFPFVAYHTCGLLREPFIRVCSEHKQVRAKIPKSNNARDLKFDCPICSREVQDGFLWSACECGDGQLSYNVHRAGTVFNPRGTVIVNPPDAELSRDLYSITAKLNAVEWVFDGMNERKPSDRKLTFESLVEVFTSSGIPHDQAKQMAEGAAQRSGGALGNGKNEMPLDGEAKEQAIEAALKLAYATAGGRTTIADLERRAVPSVAERYRTSYAQAMRQARISNVELLDRFPVLTAYFGYTRGDSSERRGRLRWFSDDRGNVRLYGLKAETEALHFRIDPKAIAQWLRARGHMRAIPQTDRDARIAIAQGCIIPSVVGPNVDTAGAELLRAIHSIAHRMIRVIASYAGIDRDALAEYIVPINLSFMIYARSSNFILGGLQALFENDLDHALHEFIEADIRCPLDPGCSQSGSACMACLHLGEPSCRYFNQALSRQALFGTNGFLEQSHRERAGV